MIEVDDDDDDGEKFSQLISNVKFRERFLLVDAMLWTWPAKVFVKALSYGLVRKLSDRVIASDVLRMTTTFRDLLTDDCMFVDMMRVIRIARIKSEPTVDDKVPRWMLEWCNHINSDQVFVDMMQLCGKSTTLLKLDDTDKVLRWMLEWGTMLSTTIESLLT